MSFSAPIQSVYQARSSRRFPISMSLEYQLNSSHKASAKGWGRGMTINLSSSGVLFESQQVLPVGRRLNLFLDWPVRRDYQVDMVLFILGRIVHRSGTSVGVEILKYEFRAGSVGRNPDTPLHSPVTHLESLNLPDGADAPKKRRGRKPMGAEERKQIAERMKRYWAARRK